jgi:D-serine deaminase-like pyridoxal phosphate-dependent protein
MTGNGRVADWFRLSNESEVPSPALVLHPDRIEENIRRMVLMAGGPDRLRPHVKTHKLPQVVAMQLAQGLRRFKAATIAEAEMCAAAGAPDVLLAYPAVGPTAGRLAELVRRYPDTRFLALTDHPASLADLGAALERAGVNLEVLVDLNVGMNRTGIAPGDEAFELYRRLATTPGVRPGGLHAYDGHLHQADRTERTTAASNAFAAVWALRDRLRAAGYAVPRLVASGTPTLPVLAAEPGVELGAGTTVLWDFGQAETCPDLAFLEAAVLLTRVISRPSPGRLTLDLGHKAVASEMSHPRVKLFGLESARFVMHSEEHLVVETPDAEAFPVGTVVYGIPRHVCPTVALHSEVWVARDGRASETWPVVARARRLTL